MPSLVRHYFVAPAAWASALVNRDFSGLDPAEAAEVRRFLADAAAGKLGWPEGLIVDVDAVRDPDGEAVEPAVIRVDGTDAAPYVTWQVGLMMPFVATIAPPPKV